MSMPIPEHSPVAERTLLRDDVFIRIRDAIVDGTFAPGEQLKDGELAVAGREPHPRPGALLRLAHGGLVVAQPGRSTIVSTIERRAIWDARDVVAAMHELAVREAVPELTASDLEAMRDANRRFAAAIDAGDVDAALRADDDLHGVPSPSAATRRCSRCSTSSRRYCAASSDFASPHSTQRASLARHDALIELCAAEDAEGAAAVAFDTWHSLPTIRRTGRRSRRGRRHLGGSGR